MEKNTTIIISPRDRYSAVEDCIAKVYAYTDESSFDLIILDLDYPADIMTRVKAQIAAKPNARIISYGSIIPMEAMDRVRHEVTTNNVVFLDNDSRVTENWLPPLERAIDDDSVGIVYPLILEKAGVDEGAELRNHLFTTELRVVDHDNTPYLIEEKSFRRALPEELPSENTESNAFELHCVMFKLDTLNTIEIPMMTIREHLDIGLQLNKMGKKLLVVPESKVLFDNLGTRASLNDLKFFNLRWNSTITEQSSRLFEKRWGYKFYSEQSIYNWAKRRRLFIVMRWAYLPIGLANIIDRAVSALRRRISPIWDPLSDPNGLSRPLFDDFDGNAPPQLDHSVK